MILEQEECGLDILNPLQMQIFLQQIFFRKKTNPSLYLAAPPLKCRTWKNCNDLHSDDDDDDNSYRLNLKMMPSLS